MIGARVAVIVVAHNGGGMLSDCIDALRATENADFEIVLVDNASSDGSVEACRERVEALVPLTVNRGFAGGVNAGIDYHVRCRAPANVYALVNQDCRVAPGWLAPLVERLRDDSRVAVVGARIYDEDGRTLQHAGATIAANGLTEHLGRGSSDDFAHREPRDVDYVTGAVCAFSRETWRTHGPFDERYFPAYFEEVDFCVRSRKAGMRIVYEPRSKAVHREASVLGLETVGYLRAYHANRMRFAATHLLVRGRILAALRAELTWLFSRRSAAEVRPALLAYLTLPRVIRESFSERASLRP
jgi:GT2 family glycosyltransferase